MPNVKVAIDIISAKLLGSIVNLFGKNNSTKPTIRGKKTINGRIFISNLYILQFPLWCAARPNSPKSNFLLYTRCFFTAQLQQALIIVHNIVVPVHHSQSLGTAITGVNRSECYCNVSNI